MYPTWHERQSAYVADDVDPGDGAEGWRAVRDGRFRQSEEGQAGLGQARQRD